jgi:oxygen-independent coproporphyrinogen-3 oxidase
MRTAAVLGLRLTEGINAAAFEEKFGVNPKTYYQKELAEFADAGLVTVDGDSVRLTRSGLFLADEVFAALI